MASQQPATMQQAPPPYQPGAAVASPVQRLVSSAFPLLLLSLAIFILSLPVLVMGLWFAAQRHADCSRSLQGLLIGTGILMVGLSWLGMMAAHRRPLISLAAYLFLLALLILWLLACTIFVFAVTRGNHGHRVWGASFREYGLTGYSHWLRRRTSEFYTWNQIKWCLITDGVCSNMNNKYPTQTILLQSKLSPIESGCCKPPTACSYTFVNATNWVRPAAAGADADCGRWSNHPLQLCYDCDSCKAGVIQQVNRDWRKAAKVLLAVLAALAVAYILVWVALLQALAHSATTPHTFTRM